MPHGSRRPRVLLADDPGMCTAISRLVSVSCDVVGSVGDSTSLFEAVAKSRPDVVLLDLSLPGGFLGFEICRHLKSTTPEVKVVVFSAHNDPEFPEHARRAGASAYVWKLQAADDVSAAIHAVVEGTPPGDEGTA